jgi:pimeloyl-ACP methyl ester carboxylesterase/AraC-like DNA-binding protein
VDVLDDILASLRLTGGVVIDGEFSGDFCVHAEFTPMHCAPFFPLPDRLIAYHFVRSGKMIIEVDGQAPVTLGPGSIAILPRNDPHLLANRPGLAPVAKAEITWVTDGGIHRVASGTAGPKAELWCGFLGTASSSVHPILDALPPLLTLDADGGEAQWLDSSMRFLAEKDPSPETVARLAEVFLSQAIRDYVERQPPNTTGWLRGLADPAVSKALSIIHSRYAEDLDVEQLAREAGVSRTVLRERFVELLGEPPMRYCGRWRMRMAANMLRDGKENTANIAYSVGFNSEAAFNRAFKREFSDPPATWRRKIEAEAADRAAASAAEQRQLPPQEVKYCTADDGTLLAWSAVGEGPPLVKTANWLNHIEFDWESPIWKHWLLELIDGHRLIRYDERGNGMSSWDTPELSLDAFIEDLEAVVSAAGVDQFDLLAISQGCAVSVAYAVRYPHRVRRMILYGGYAAGWAKRSSPEELERREAMVALTKAGWGSDNPAYRQLFTSLYVPDATPEQQEWFNDLQRMSASPENSVRIQRALSQLDVRDLLDKVTTPTLVIHARDDQVVPFNCAEELASKIPGARLLPLEGRNHILLKDEPAWPNFVEAVGDFLGSARGARRTAPTKEPPRQGSIHTCSSADGMQIAYATCGEGFPLVKAPNAVTHLELDRSNPIYGHWIGELSRSNRLIRFDMRGFGMSQWDPPEFSLDSHVADLAAVVEASGIEKCDLIGLTHGAAVAIAYAARNPHRVRKLVLLNAFAAGWAIRADHAELAWRKSMVELNRKRWRRDNVILGERFMSLYFPSSATDIIAWHESRIDEICTAATVERMLEWGSTIDVRDELANVRAQTLVIHAAHEGNAPLEVGA